MEAGGVDKRAGGEDSIVFITGGKMRGGIRSGQEDKKAGHYCIRWMVRGGRRSGQKHWILQYQADDERGRKSGQKH